MEHLVTHNSIGYGYYDQENFDAQKCLKQAGASWLVTH